MAGRRLKDQPEGHDCPGEDGFTCLLAIALVLQQARINCIHSKGQRGGDGGKERIIAEVN